MSGTAGIWPPYLAQISESLSTKYTYVKEAGHGRNGVAHAIECRTSGRLACLKTVRPESAESAIAAARETLDKEVRILAPLEHRCLPVVYERCTAADVIPYYVCTFHPGVTFQKFQQLHSRLSKEQADFVIYQLFDALEYLHSQGRTHCDFHYNNILISEHVYRDGILVIDFGSGHRGSDGSSATEIRGDARFRDIEQQGRTREPVDREQAMEHFRIADFKALGHLLGFMSECFFGEAASDQQMAYRNFCESLQQGKLTSWTAAKERYQTVADPRVVLNRSSRLFKDGTGARRAIQVPVTPLVAVGDPVLRVVNTKTFQRLRFTKQLSFCEWFFPGGTHTRFEHSLGVLETTRQALEFLVDLPAFRDSFTSFNIEGALLAALIHDIGHYPFAHVMEHYVVSRFADTASAQDARRVASHANYTIELARSPELRDVIETTWGKDHCDEAVRVIEKRAPILSSLLDGPVDTDKIDYLRRDSHHCGFAYGDGIDIQRIFQGMRAADQGRRLGFAAAAVTAVEGFMIVQEQMLASLYWQEQIRGVVAMFHAYVAAFIGKDIEKLKHLVAVLKQCSSDQQAMSKAILPYLRSLHSVNRERKKAGFAPLDEAELLPLVNLHVRPCFDEIYTPIARYRRTDALPPKTRAYQTIHNAIVTPTVTQSSTVPVNWRAVSVLRHCYLDALREKAGASSPPSRFEVLIDVPLGKHGDNVLTIVDDRTGSEFPITDTSHLKASIFAEPTAHLAPVRVYVSPRLYAKHKNQISSIRASAEERFYSGSYRTEELDD